MNILSRILFLKKFKKHKYFKSLTVKRVFFGEYFWGIFFNITLAPFRPILDLPIAITFIKLKLLQNIKHNISYENTKFLISMRNFLLPKHKIISYKLHAKKIIWYQICISTFLASDYIDPSSRFVFYDILCT